MDDREVRPAAVGAEEPEFLVHRVGPLEFSGLTVEALEEIADAEGVDVPRLRVGDDARPADPLRRSVREVDVEPLFPDRVAVLDVDADDPFPSSAGFSPCRG